MVYPALLPLMRTLRLQVVDQTVAPADLNELVCFAERRNMVSARVPSRFKRSLPKATQKHTNNICTKVPQYYVTRTWPVLLNLAGLFPTSSPPHRLHVSTNQFTTTPSTRQSQPVHHHTVYTSVPTSSPSHRPHISPNQFTITPSTRQSQPVHHHTVHTSPTRCIKIHLITA
jgi:hypothetical protein